MSILGVLPWRCVRCETRFYSRAIPLRYIIYARCGICGNLELEKVPPERVTGVTSKGGRWLGLPSLRCAPCRYNFFALRPQSPVKQVASLEAEETKWPAKS